MSLPIIFGFNKTSEAGNDKLNFSIFLKGCNLRCPYCMNSKLVVKSDVERIDFSIIKQAIIEEKPEMVMISGGEPILHSYHEISELISTIQNLGCKVGMSTNGLIPERLKEVVLSLSFVALDIKTSRPLVYDGISGCFRSLARVLESKEIIEKFCLDYEIRTTLYPPFINENDIHIIGNLVSYNTKWVLQQFRVTKNMLNDEHIGPYSEEHIREFLEIAKNYTEKASLRYV